MSITETPRVLRYSDLKAAGYGDRVTIWRRVREGKFPPPKDFLGRPGWLDSTIREWAENRPSAA